MAVEDTLTRFVRALRMAEVRVSTAETLDALRVAETIGWHDRGQLKDALAATLAKSADEDAAFDACFDRFFRVDDIDADPPDDDLPAAAPDAQNGHAAGPGDGQGSGGGSGGPPAPAEADANDATRAPPTPFDAPASPLGRMLMADDRAALATAVARAMRATRVDRIQVFTQQALYTRRVLDDLGRDALVADIAALDASPRPAHRALAVELRRRQDRLRAQIRDRVEREFLLHADARGERLREQMLENARLANVPRRDDELMRRMIARMARRLAAAHTPKRRVTRRGRLDVPRMIRRNMRHDAHLIEQVWQSKRVDKPRVFAICDVSGSVARHARFMLMFLYGLEAVLPRLRAFVFCADMHEVTGLFQAHDADHAVRRTLAAYGNASTDYAQALADFQRLALDDVDRRSTVLILGDARNNQGEPRADLLRVIAQRCRRLIWLNPEPRSGWDTGDSVMHRYRPHCHQVNECASLRQLERVIALLLRRAG